MGHSSHRRAVVALLATVFVLVAGCGGGGANPLPKAQAPSSSPTPTDPGVSVAGLATEDVDVTTQTGVSPGASLSFASPIYSVAVANELTSPTKVQLTLDNALPRTQTVFVVTRQTSSDPWTYLPARLMTDQRHVEFTTTHLSDFAVLSMDVDGALQNFRDDVRTRLATDYIAKLDKPQCDETAKAKEDGYSVGHSRGKKTLYWCFGLEGDKRVIKVVNRRTVPIQVVHGEAPEIDPSTPPKTWTAWESLLGDEASFLAPGKTATYDVDLEPLERVLVGASVDSKVQSLRAFQATVGAVVAAVTDFGGKGSTVKVVNSLLARPQCAKAMGLSSDKMLAACLSRRKVIATFGTQGMLISRLTSAKSTATFLRKQFQVVALDAKKNDVQNIVVRRAKPNFAALVGSFSGEGRSMTISADGLVFESVSNVTDDGTEQVADLTYQLSEPKTDGGVTRAKAVITKAKIYDRKAFRDSVPRAGDTATVTVEKGVIRSPFVKRNYCGQGAKKNACS